MLGDKMVGLADASERAAKRMEELAETVKMSKRVQRGMKEARAARFADIPIYLVGTDDMMLDRLQKRNKEGELRPIEVQEMIFRMELQRARKHDKRQKAKKKRQAKRRQRVLNHRKSR